MKPECVTCGARFKDLVILQCGRCGSREEFCRVCLKRREDQIAWTWLGGWAIQLDREYLCYHKVCPKKRWILKPKARRVRWRIP